MPPLRLLLVGHGRMGQLVESLAPGLGFEVAAWVDEFNNPNGERLTPGDVNGAEVAVDFSTADAFIVNLPRMASIRLNVVVGTTGWYAHEAQMRRIVEEAGIGVVAAANFSLGVNLFEAIVEHAARLFTAYEEYGAWLHEAHHAAKLDAPSGTALTLVRDMQRAGYSRKIDVSSTRAGAIPGTHTVGFDGPSDSITLTHVARDRSGFARGALTAARWVHRRSGWFTMRDVLGLSETVTT